MAESTSESQVSPSTPSLKRRELFKKSFSVLVGGAAVAAAGKGAAQETEAAKGGIHTSSGVFYPLEERHSARRKLPDNLPLDALFREVLPKFEIDAGPRLSPLLKATISEPFLASGQVPVWSPEILEQLSRKGIPLILGDVKIQERSEDSAPSFPFNTAIEGIKTFLGVAAVGAAVAERPKGLFTRRRFLKSSAVAAGGILAAPWLSRVPLAAAVALDPEQEAAATRVLTRLHGLASHSAPEDPVLFFRNVVMANNLLSTAEHLKGLKGALPYIAFNVGAAHAGMEDFLRLGHDFTRWLISLYPNRYLENIINLNGGLENFCAARILTLPKDYKVEGPNEQPIIDEKLVDDDLLNMLKQKMPDYVVREEGKKRQEEEKKQQDLETMRQNVGKIKELFSHYASSGIGRQIRETLDTLLVLPKYKEFIKVEKKKIGDSDDTVSKFTISLPVEKGKIATNDIEGWITETPSGQIIEDHLKFFVDSNGQLTRKQDQDTAIVSDKEDLIELLETAVPISKNLPAQVRLDPPYTDEAGWEYPTHIRVGGEKDGLRIFFRDNTLDGFLYIKKNGEITMRNYVRTKEAVDRGVSTR